MKKVRVLVADDSAFMRKIIQNILSASNQIEIVGTARNGEDAIKKTKVLKPDVVTMDFEMPVLNGLEALKRIMKESPVPVVMLSSTTQKGAENTLLAIQNGAVDFIAKPSGTISLDLDKISDEIVEKVLAAKNANIGRLKDLKNPNLFSAYLSESSKIELDSTMVGQNLKTPWKKSLKKLVLIGTSTGGPKALQTVLSQIPKDIQAPLLVVQHMPAGFTKSLAVRLNSQSRITVREAEDGDVLENGTAYIAPGGYHLIVKEKDGRLVIQLDNSELRNGHRPSVDLLFESVSLITDYAKIAVIMTGMGSDGTKGLIHLSEKGTVVAIAESKETAIVFGMPKAAISTKLVNEIQNVEDIARTILKYV